MAISLYELKSLAIVSSGGNELAIDASGNISALQAGTWSVDAVQSGTWNIGTVSTITNAVTVTATALDIRALTASDVVTANQGGTWTVAATQSGTWTVGTTQAGFASWKVSAAAPTTSAAQLVSTPLTGRVRIIIENNGGQTVYLGTTNAVTSSNGLVLPKGSDVEMDLAAGAQIWAIAASGTGDLRISEFAP